MQYTKGPLTFEDQLVLMQQRGLTVGDVATAEKYLQRVGYYRLMGYLYPFRRPLSDDYEPGSMFEWAVEHYVFDQRLRALVLDAICHIEVAARTAITYVMAHAHGSFAYTKLASFEATPTLELWHPGWLERVEKEVKRSREEFIDHFREKYDGFPHLPIWMATEVMSLGTISQMLAKMRIADQKSVASYFNVQAPVLANWIHCVSVVRNICAHHGRLWNKHLGVSPTVPRSSAWQYMAHATNSRKMFFMLMVIATLLESTSAEAKEWRARVNELLDPLLADEAGRDQMGAPSFWQTHPAWQIR